MMAKCMRLIGILFYFGVEAVFEFCTTYSEHILLVLGPLILLVIAGSY